MRVLMVRMWYTMDSARVSPNSLPSPPSSLPSSTSSVFSALVSSNPSSPVLLTTPELTASIGRKSVGISTLAASIGRKSMGISKPYFSQLFNSNSIPWTLNSPQWQYQSLRSLLLDRISDCVKLHRHSDSDSGEKFSKIVGSPYYMAPKVLKRNYVMWGSSILSRRVLERE